VLEKQHGRSSVELQLYLMPYLRSCKFWQNQCRASEQTTGKQGKHGDEICRGKSILGKFPLPLALGSQNEPVSPIYSCSFANTSFNNHVCNFSAWDVIIKIRD